MIKMWLQNKMYTGEILEGCEPKSEEFHAEVLKYSYQDRKGMFQSPTNTSTVLFFSSCSKFEGLFVCAVLQCCDGVFTSHAGRCPGDPGGTPRHNTRSCRRPSFVSLSSRNRPRHPAGKINTRHWFNKSTYQANQRDEGPGRRNAGSSQDQDRRPSWKSE